jgi:hypothetical protein
MISYKRVIDGWLAESTREELGYLCGEMASMVQAAVDAKKQTTTAPGIWVATLEWRPLPDKT